MAWMIVGLWLWSSVHFVPSVAPDIKSAWKEKLGVGGYAGTFSLLIVLSIVLMVVGWKSMQPVHLYNSPGFARHLTMLLVLFGFVFIVAGRYPSRLRQRIRNPMLIGFKLWAVAHLLVNGDSRSLMLFGTLLIWAVISVITINRRDVKTPRQETVVSLPADVALMGLSVVVYIVIALYAHPWLSGVALM
ncbi:MAG: NnrU family protein [Pseudomonadota bacterium]